MHILHQVAVTRYHLKHRNQTQLRAQIEEKINFTEQSSQFLPGLKLLLPATQKGWFAKIRVSEVLLWNLPPTYTFHNKELEASGKCFAGSQANF